MKRLRIYLDTSVFGGCFDEEFSKASQKLFEEIREGRFKLLLSTTVIEKLKNAPIHDRQLLNDLPDDSIERVILSDEMEYLRDAYVEAGVVGLSSLIDAEHVAAATVVKADLIVSWNFKHIVQYKKIRGYHPVNLMQGYGVISIHTPQEVIEP